MKSICNKRLVKRRISQSHNNEQRNKIGEIDRELF